jgi:EmrB/QacA subfamily drug resistance transporter
LPLDSQMTLVKYDSTGAVVPRGGGQPVALAILCTLLFLTFLDNTVVSVGLGSVQADLHAGVLALQWIVGAYALTFASAMLAFGTVGDKFGRKKVMLAGAGVFCAGSVLCALAPDAGVLIAGRAVMGLGAAASEPGTLSMLRHLYRDERARNRAIGVWAAVSGLALAVGPVLGGALVGLWNWRAIFWFNLIFGAAALVAATIVLPANADPEAHRVDIAGALLGAAALAALIFGVMTGEGTGFTAPAVLALFCVSAAAGSAFLWREYRAAHPLLDLRFLRVARFTIANTVAFCSYFATFAIFFFTALYLDEVVGYSGFRIALAFLPMTVLMITSSVLAGMWLSSTEPRWPISAGCLAFAAGLLLTNAVLSPHPPFTLLAAALALTGAGIGWTVVPITSSVLGAVPPERSGMAASAANTSREIGAVTGVAVLGALVNAQLHADLISRLNRLGIPPNFQSIVVNAVETGGVPPSGTTSSAGGSGNAAVVQQVINAAYHAFGTGLHAALYLAAGLVIGAGILAAIALRPPAHPGGPGHAAKSR